MISYLVLELLALNADRFQGYQLDKHMRESCGQQWTSHGRYNDDQLFYFYKTSEFKKLEEVTVDA